MKLKNKKKYIYVFLYATLFISIREGGIYIYEKITRLKSNTLIENSTNLYDRKLNKIGYIKYKKNENGLLVSINGEEITNKFDESRDSYKYYFAGINYQDINMKLVKKLKENYYYYDTGDSIILICQLLDFYYNNTTYSEKPLAYLKNNKHEKIFLITEVDYDSYYSNSVQYEIIQNGYLYYDNGIKYIAYFVQ